MKKHYLRVFSFVTSINILLVSHVEASGNIRAGLEQNYVRAFQWWDGIIFVVLCMGIYKVAEVFVEKVMPRLQASYEKYGISEDEKWKEGHVFAGSFLFILLLWSFFFWVFYPGTAMNDTIYILQEPQKLCYQHPVLYVVYTYFFYRIGIAFDNPNLGMALLSLTQMLMMDYVISYAIVMLHRKMVAIKICILLVCYFAFMPLFSTYAVSAIKDTPFSIALFYLCILLWELAESKGEKMQDVGFCLKCMVTIGAVTAFRSNGMLIAIGTWIILLVQYKGYRMTLTVSFVIPICVSYMLSAFFMPLGVEKLFQEQIGIPLQQVSAVVVGDGEIRL